MTAPEGPRKLFIIDGSSVFYRAFHAIPTTLTSPEGTPTNAVYGFTQTLRKIINEYRPDYLAVAFDSRGPSFRHERFEGYKAERPSMPDELSVQLPYIKDVAASLGAAVLEMPAYEADDIMATIDARVDGTGVKVVLITGDKDMYQLVDDDTVILDYNTGKEFGATEVEEKFGVGPDKIRDLLSLAGDASDSIPGVPGVGPKTAVKLLREYGSFDGIYENVDSITAGKLKEKLKEFREQAEMSRELATLHTEVPVECGLESLGAGPPDIERLTRLFGELGFTRLLAEITREAGGGTDEGGATTLVDTEKQLKAVAEAIAKAGGRVAVVIDAEGEGMEATLSGIGIDAGGDAAYVTPLGDDALPVSVVADALRGVLEDEGVKKITDDAKSLHLQFLRLGVEVRGASFDTSLASYLLAPTRSDHGVEASAVEYLGAVLGSGAEAGRRRKASAAAPFDVDLLSKKTRIIRLLAEELDKRLEADGLASLFAEMELPLARILARMEHLGICVDPEALTDLSREMEVKLEGLESGIYAAAGAKFNINSPKQLSGVLFDTLGLKPVKKTKTGYSTDEEVLKKLAAHHEVPGLILSFRSIAKLKSTYVDALLGLIDPDTGRVHTSFNQTVTATGRLSSSRPNLQNIPVRGEDAARIRSAFVAGEGYTLLCSDYSQIELRIVAHLSGDPTLVDSFLKDEDIHSRTASEVFGVIPGLVTSEMRRRAKAINFGIIYGMGPYGLSVELGITAREAEEYIESYFAHYGGVREFIERTIEGARNTGYTTTIFGRRRHIPELKSPVEQVRRLGARIATNTPVQGAAADIIKAAMINVDRALTKGGFRSRMLLQIHDELLFEAAAGEEDRLAELVRAEMEGVIELKVPVRVNIKTGPDWGSVQ